MDVEDRIDLGRGHLRPAEAERRHAQLHRPEHEARFLAHRLRRLVAAPNDAPFIAGTALTRFAASSGNKAARRAVFARHGVAEGVERRRDGRVDFRGSVREDGFEYEGQRYRSLTLIAERITGAHWSGPRFLGLTKRAGIL